MGTWFQCEPGTNPGFLYQQNTMRDAIVAGVTLNVFNKHCERVKMANLAQMVNVLQAVILTEGDKMILTPTYHVFDLYQKHMDADLVDSYIESKTIGVEDLYKVPNVTESVSVDKDGNLQLTISNTSITESYEIETLLATGKVKSITGRILTSSVKAYNTFEQPENVVPVEFHDYQITSEGIKFNIPACSVLHLEVNL